MVRIISVADLGIGVDFVDSADGVPYDDAPQSVVVQKKSVKDLPEVRRAIRKTTVVSRGSKSRSVIIGKVV